MTTQHNTVTLKDLGNKIAIIGASSSGKSTLANQLSLKLNIPVYYLDCFAHYHGTKWQRRPDEEFIEEHEKLIQKEEWIIEGNYSITLPERIKKSTFVILIDSNRWLALWRYIKRSLKNNPDRAGRLPGAKREFAWYMIKFLLIVTPRRRRHYKELLTELNARFIHIKSMKELNYYYKEWQLKKP